MNQGRITDRFMRLAEVLVGHIGAASPRSTSSSA
jgi:hypothetical protein